MTYHRANTQLIPVLEGRFLEKAVLLENVCVFVCMYVMNMG